MWCVIRPSSPCTIWTDVLLWSSGVYFDVPSALVFLVPLLAGADGGSARFSGSRLEAAIQTFPLPLGKLRRSVRVGPLARQEGRLRPRGVFLQKKNTFMRSSLREVTPFGYVCVD